MTEPPTPQSPEPTPPDPTSPAQLALARQLRLVETLAWEHDADPGLVHDEVTRAYRIDGPGALRFMAATAAVRLEHLRNHHHLGGEPGRGLRELFHGYATIDDHDLVGACIDLVEQAVPGADQRGAARELLDILVASGRGHSALIELLSIAMTTAQQLAETSTDLAHPRDLIAREAATSERRWLDPGHG